MIGSSARIELIDTVWNGRAISEAAFSSRINGARRVLGDNGTDQLSFGLCSAVASALSAMFRPSGADCRRQFGLRRTIPPRRATLPAQCLDFHRRAHLDDVVSDAVKAEAVTRASIAVLPFENSIE